MSQSATHFLEVLEKSRIFSARRLGRTRSQLEAVQRPLPDDQAVADLLVKCNVLTRFQADSLLQGRYRSLRTGDYALLDPLGWGGMGTVYRGWDVETQRTVAVKILAERFRHDAGMRARFQLEGRAGQQLDHPRLLKTFVQGQVEDVFGQTEYMVMELFEGVGLNELVEQVGKLSIGTACSIALQAAEGLGHLHERGLVHRDVKCENVLVNKAGEVKVIDFGLALADQELYDDEFSLSMIFGHDCLGTVDYMPPEQIKDSLHVDRRADVYTLGGVLFGITAARLPYPRKSRKEVAEAHKTASPPRLREFTKTAPVELEELILAMLAKRPEDRPSSMADVIAVLRNYATLGPLKFSYSQVLEKRRRIAEQKGLESASLARRASTATARSTAVGGGISSTKAVPPEPASPAEVAPTPRSSSRGHARRPEPLTRPVKPHASSRGRWLVWLLSLATAVAAGAWYFLR